MLRNQKFNGRSIESASYETNINQLPNQQQGDNENGNHESNIEAPTDGNQPTGPTKQNDAGSNFIWQQDAEAPNTVDKSERQVAERFRNMGQRGGEATWANHDREFYQAIGGKGGRMVSENHDSNHFRDIGHRGGEATAASHDRAYYQEIGRKGGRKAKRGFKQHRENMQRGEDVCAASHDSLFDQAVGRFIRVTDSTRSFD